jgi:hypothetical protein
MASNNDDFLGFEEARAQSQIANQVFEERFKHVTERLTRQESLSMNVITGSVVGLFLVLATLIWGAWAFIASYNTHYIQTEKSFSEQINQLRKENFDFKEEIIKDEQAIHTLKP